VENQELDLEDFGEVLETKVNLAVLRISKKEEEYSERVHGSITSQFHTHKVDESHRSFLVNLDEINRILQEAKRDLGGDIALSMRMFVPNIDDGIRYDTRNMQNIVIRGVGEFLLNPILLKCR